MITRTVSIAILIFLFAANVTAQDASGAMSLDQAFEQLATYELGDSQVPLRIIRNACWAAADDPTVADALEARLIDMLQDDDATAAAKMFVCRQMGLGGGKNSVGALAPLLLDEHLSWAARSALQWMPYAAVDVALEQAEENASGDILVGIQNSLAVREEWIRGMRFQEVPDVLLLAELAAEGSVAGAETLHRLRGGLADEEIARRIPDAPLETRLILVRALGARGATAQRPALERLAQLDDDSGVRVAALLAIVEFLRADQAAERVEIMARAISIAEEPADVEACFDVLAGLHCSGALALAVHHLETDGSSAAARAVLSIATAAGDDPAQRDAALAAANLAYERFADDAAIRKAAGDAIAHIDRNVGFIQNWRVSGPFTADEGGTTRLFDEAFAPEPGGHGGAALEWNTIDLAGLEPPGIVNLAREIGGDERVAYLMAVVRSDSDQPARLEIGSDDAVKAWVNGELVHQNNVTRGLTLNSDIVPIQLRAGENTILLKIVQGGGDWKAAARIRAADGTRAISVSLE